MSLWSYRCFSFISDFLLFHEEEAGLERHEKVHSDVTDVVNQITTLEDSNILNFMSACKSLRLKHNSFNSWPITQFTGITVKVCLRLSAESLPSENAVGSLLNGYIQALNHCVLFSLSSSLSQWPRRATSSASKSFQVNVTFILPRNVWLLTTHNYDAHACNSDTRLINNQRTG